MPGGCSSPMGSIGGPSCQQLPSQVLVAADGCGSGKGLTFQGQACYRICCREAKLGRLGYKHPDNKDL